MTEPRVTHQIYDGRREMRSLADATAKLIEIGCVSSHDSIEVRTYGFEVQRGKRSGVVGVVSPTARDGTRWSIQMPTSDAFWGTSTLGERAIYPITALNEAITDLDGNVTLHSGRFVHDVVFCQSAPKIGSDAFLVQLRLFCAD
jgi:hypothetical protein